MFAIMGIDYKYKTEPRKHQRELLEATADIPSLAIFWEMRCVDSQTEYLSPSGWKKISEYTEGQVAQWNHLTKQASFITPSRYIKTPCEKMLKIKHTCGVDQMLSPEHTVPVVERDGKTIRLISAEQLYHECTVVSKRGRDLPSVFFMEGQEGIALTDAQLRLQIAVMADAGFPNHSPYTRQCGFNLKKHRKIERLKKLLAQAEVSYDLEICDDGYHKFKRITAPLRLKTYSEIFWKASSHQLKIICDEVMHWDGTIKPRRNGEIQSSAFFSIKEADVDFLQYAFATQGKITRKKLDDRPNPCWTMSVRSKEPFFNVGRNHMSWQPSTDGFGYCFEVPDGFLIFRRNGCIFPSGNCGKTKLIIDNIAYLYQQGRINAALIIAPSGVDLNWVLDEIPLHLPEEVAAKSRFLRFNTKKAATKSHKEEVKWLLQHNGLAWLIMSYDAVMTDAGKEAFLHFLDKRVVFYTLDESVSIKTPGAKRTMRIVRTAHRAKYRRILDGYPSPQGAFDMYSQIKFLDEDFWKRHNWDSFTAFKSYFGVFERAFNHKQGNEYEKFLGFKNLEELNKLIAPISSRLLQKDVLNIQLKNYEFRYFELTPKQRAMYDQLEEEFRIRMDSGELVTANLPMVRDLRLQQISCGYIPIDADEPIHQIEGKNPRLELMESLLENQNEKCIIWARYKFDVRLITDMLRKNRHVKFAAYTGDTSEEDCTKARNDFQKGDLQYFVATLSKGFSGITLHKAKNVYYYSNSFNLRHRKQSEDRAITDGQDYSVNVFDLVGHDTRDKRIIQNLCRKMDTSDIVMGDETGHDMRTQLENWEDL